MGPWMTELERTWSGAGEGVEGRKLVIDLQNVTVISREGESGIYELMQEGARFSCAGVLTRHLLKRLPHRCQARFPNVNQMCSTPSQTPPHYELFYPAASRSSPRS